ncbi:MULTISPECIES: hypothetical protein [Chryseobacterium]|uniref:Uncharacterized protein n=1 Tax=Chryseobacterium potabilaquae TaxID=2675057 RepID=A0A6N4X8K3_9FLAO|nr:MULTISPECIES: hypothetical protein [Chryseobacterium]CAA7196009.1 hypothetical protein CHRY9293_02150 [Chryseobacterium potabilaquae]
MKETLKRIVLVIFVLLLLTAISGFFYMQKHPLEKAFNKKMYLTHPKE